MSTNSNASAQDVFSSAGAFWSSASAWSLGGPPVATQDVFVGAGAAGAASADSIANVTVNSIAVNAASTLTVDFGTIFTATNGTTLAAADTAGRGGGNAGLVDVTGGGTLVLGGAFVNKGGIEIARANLGDSGALTLLGDVTLSGGGHVYLGIAAGAASTMAPISGGGLVNVDNVISGGGLVTLTTLDNRAGGVFIANHSYDDDLTLSIAQFTNEGAFDVAANAAMMFGHDGQSHSLLNSGVVAVGYDGVHKGANSQLVIAGNFTVSGSGAIDLVGDNALVLSDQVAATFTNAGALVATATSQVGDAGQGFDDLTFINSGSVTATGAGVTLTLSTPGFAISDSGLMRAFSGATLTLATEVDLAGAGAIVEAGAGGTVQLAGSLIDKGGAGGLVVDAGGKMNLAAAAAAAATIHGASGATAGGVLTVQANASLAGLVTFASAGGVLNLIRQKAPITVAGDGGLITLTSASVVAMGSGETISALGLVGNAATVGGTGETLSGGHASFALLAGASAVLTGDADAVTVSAGASLTVNGSGNTVTAAAHASVSVGGDGGFGANIVNSNGASVTIAANAHAQVNGDDDTMFVGAGAVISVSGANDTLQGSAARMFLSGSQAVTGSNDRLIIGAGSHLDLNGVDDNVHIGAGTSMNLTGSAARLIGAGFALTAASGADFWIGGTGSNGAADTVSASNATIRIGGSSNIAITGDNDTVAALALSHVSLMGAGILAHFGPDATAIVGGNGATGAADTLTGTYFNASILANSNVTLGTYGATATVGDHANVQVTRTLNVVTAGAFDTIDVVGTNDKVVLGMDDVVSDNGSGSVFVVGAPVGATILAGFGSDGLGVLDLTNGVGGFATANDAYAALTGDGAGGLQLALGSAGTIDFTGASAAMLSAANFKIG